MNGGKVHFHATTSTPRVRYAVQQLLGRLLGWEVEEVTDPVAFAAIKGPKLYYGPQGVVGAFHVVPSGLLAAAGTAAVEPDLAWLGDLPVLFPERGGDLPFDVLAAAFFCLARYEEYGPLLRDEHGRPRADGMHALRHGYVERPVVDEWALLLAERWRTMDPRVPQPVRRYAQMVTMDVDNGFMYLGRPLWRMLGAFCRDLLRAPAMVGERMAVLLGKRPDPYDVHQRLRELAQRAGASVVLNYLVAPVGRNDHAVGPAYGPMRARMREATTWAMVGLHPGYHSMRRPEYLARDKRRLERALGMPIVRSRQHFLRFRLPATYRNLIQLGIKEEHSMGFADRIGFRAGTCTPYAFYDLLEEQTTALVVHPFAIMDSALCYKMKLSPEQAVARVRPLIERVRAVQGNFVGVYHERFLADHGTLVGWRAAVEGIVEAART